MAASQASLELRNNTDANFRLWGSFISNGLAAGGWTLEDTDINWTTVSAPAQNTYAGYEIWKSPDEVGLTNFYLKLRYGSHNNATVGPALEWTIGWGYPGSGSSLSGITTTVVSSQSGASAASSTARTCSIAAGDGYVVINLGNAAASACGHLIIIERNRGTDIEPRDEVTCIAHYHDPSGVTVAFQTITPTTAYRQATGVATSVFEYVIFDYAVASIWPNVHRGAVAVCPITGLNEARTSPLRSIMLIRTISSTVPMLGVGGETVDDVETYGEPHTYIIMLAPSGGGVVGGQYHPLLGGYNQYSFILRHD